MKTRIALATTLAALGAATTAHATNARVEAMGKHDTYFMDDVSIWTNPANANLYPNYLLGELGTVSSDTTSSSSDFSALARYNRDPQNPWFGAVFAKSLSSDTAGGNRYPQIVVGGALNRKDPLIDYLPTKTSAGVAPELTTNADFLLGFASAGGFKIGLKGFVALSDSTNSATDYSGKSAVYSGVLGINAPAGQGVDVEATLGLASLTTEVEVGSAEYKPEAGLSYMASARAMVAAPSISGMIVPAASFSLIDAPQLDETNARAGIGANVSLDRGFFWIGVDGFMRSTEAKTTSAGVANDTVSAVTTDEYGARISFGIERNVWWDWFVLRVGGQKVISTVDDGTVSYWASNPEGDGTADDHVSFGFGLNIEDKLKVDAVVAEDILFTGGNLLGGPVDHVFSRISATYSF